ncbi:MAG: TRAP transporter TatT component family protein [Deltaproteobacteria bacterium]|nr:TRAP transporter TatT component family protein [Deltaproteobacteria bacterium]
MFLSSRILSSLLRSISHSLVARRVAFATLVFTAVGASGCSLHTMAVNQTVGLITKSMPAFEQEWDFELVSRALPANIKTIEGFLMSAPKNADLLMMLARAYSAYALVLIEDRMEREQIRADDADEEEAPEADRQRLRAREMYARAHRYALRALETRHEGFSEAFKKGRETLDAALATCSKDDVPALFWTVMPLASAINIGRDDVSLIAALPKVKVVMTRIVELDEGFYYGGAHLVLGGIYGGVSPTLGGDPVRAKKHFERALVLTKRRFLLVQMMYARTFAVQEQDQKLFRALLGEVQSAKLSILPAQRLANVAAKRKVTRLLKRVDELF